MSSKFSSFEKEQKLFESWRNYTKEKTSDLLQEQNIEPEPELTWEELSMEPEPETPWEKLSKEEQMKAKLDALEQEAGQLQGELANLRRTTSLPEERSETGHHWFSPTTLDRRGGLDPDVGISQWSTEDLENLLQNYGYGRD